MFILSIVNLSEQNHQDYELSPLITSMDGAKDAITSITLMLHPTKYEFLLTDTNTNKTVHINPNWTAKPID
jgi:hypothetical protein